jgi:ketosteroid isomerase-like protein
MILSPQQEIRRGPMETFARLFGRLLTFVYHCFDRIVIQGYLPLMTRPEHIVYFFLTDDAVFRYGAQEPVNGREAIRGYVDGFFGLTDDAVFRYGAQEPVNGREAIRGYVDGFFGTIASLEHQVIETWKGDGSLVCRGEVAYTKLDGARVRVPFTNVFRLEGDLIREYLVYIDPTPLMG